MNRTDIIKELIQSFPETPTLTLAKKVYKEHPSMFSSVEVARSAIRYQRGNNGINNRKQTKDKSKFRKNCEAGYSMCIPKSIAKPINAFKLPQGKTAIMSDIHIPYHDDKALAATLDHIDYVQPDNILLNGDICDFFTVSRWNKNPEERNLAAELQANRQFLGHLRERSPKSRIIYKIGNHEERWEIYLWTKAPEICGVADFELSSILEFDKWGIEHAYGRQKIKAGKHLTIIHGHEIPGAYTPVNFARTLQTNLGVCTIGGHRHQTSTHAFKNADDKIIQCWSLGCLCEMHPHYAPVNKWNHGFAIVELSGNDFDVENMRVIDGGIYS